MQSFLRVVAVLVAAAGVLGTECRIAQAQQAGGLAIELPEIRNYVGLGAGIIPDYTGSDDYTFGAAPVGLVHFDESERYLRLVVSELYFNALDSKEWSFGPVLNYRWGRDNDSIEDNVVKRMHSIDGTIEGGAFLGWSWVGEDDPRHRLNLSVEFLHAITGGYDGFVASASARYFQPVSRALTLSLGVGTTYGSEDYMETYFGVSSGNAARSGLSKFNADGGMRDVRISPMVILSLSPNWHVAGGVIYSRLLGDAEDSPIVDKRGNANQFFAGLGVAYAW